MRWWTSDTHFGHESILGFGRERWASIGEHDRDLVDNWNDVVCAGDEVWHLGDVAWGFDRLIEVLPTLKGRITLVAGNHDSWWPHYRRGFVADESLNSRMDMLAEDLSYPMRTLADWRRRRDEVARLRAMGVTVHPSGSTATTMRLPGNRTIDVDVSHLPEIGSDPYLVGHLAVAAPAPTKTVRVCGHVHSLWARHGRSINVGVDVNGWAPVSDDDLAAEVGRIIDAG